MTILPMKPEPKPRKIIALATWIIITLGFLAWGAPIFFDSVMDRLEHQKEARAAYMYETYGDLYTK